MGEAECVGAAYLRSNQPCWSKALLPWWQSGHSLWCSDVPRKTDRRLISFAPKRKTCSFQSELLIHMQMEWLQFFLIFFTWGWRKKKKPVFDHHINSKWAEILGLQAYEGPLPYHPCRPAPAICPSVYLITATWGGEKTTKKLIKGWVILLLLTDSVHIFHALACISYEKLSLCSFSLLGPCLSIERAFGTPTWHQRVSHFTGHRD